MQKKCGQWLADWRDVHGTRKRKAFPSKAAALKYQRKMARLAAAKKAPAQAQ